MLNFLEDPPARDEYDYDSFIASLSVAEKMAMASTLRGAQDLWLPLLDSPQHMAMQSDADVVLFGGAAGGGKTDLAVGMALTQHERTLFIRKESTQLTAVEDRIEQIIGTRKGYNGQKKVWRIEQGGGRPRRQIQLGGVNNPGDETGYQGNPRDLLILDEVANIPEFQVRFLMGWVRSTTPGQRCRTLMCSNPPTNAEGQWLIQYFAPWLIPGHRDAAQPGELRWFAVVKGKDVLVSNGKPFDLDGETVTPQSRTFIPSRISDNPYLAGTGYLATLQAMPEPLRSQMLYGDFMAGQEDDAWQVVPSDWVQAAMDRWEPTHKDQRGGMTSMGVDPSRGGQDESVIATRFGNWYSELVSIEGAQVTSGPSLAREVLYYRRDAAPIHVDAIGIGASVVDHLQEQPVQVESVTGSEGSSARDRSSGRLTFRNLRSQIYWQFREALDPNGPNRHNPVCLPPCPQLKADLCAPTFRVMEGDKIAVEKKEDLKKRIGRSPDKGDAVIYCSIYTPKRTVQTPKPSTIGRRAKRSIGKNK